VSLWCPETQTLAPIYHRDPLRIRSLLSVSTVDCARVRARATERNGLIEGERQAHE